MRAKNALVCAVAVLLSLALAAAADAQNKGRGGGGKGKRQPPQQQPQSRDWQAWDDDVNARAAAPAVSSALTIEQDTLSARAGEKTSALTRQITLFSITLRSDYVLDSDERDALFDLLDGVGGAIFGRMRPGDNPPLNSAIADDLLCGATSGADAKELCDQISRILEIKRKLGGREALTSFHRAMLQAEFNWLAANLHNLPREGRASAPEPAKETPK